MKITMAFFSVFLSFSSFSQKTKITWPQSSSPVVFAPGFISDGFDNRDMAISPKGDEIFFTIQHRALSVIMYSKKTGDAWSQPQVADFSGRFKDLEATFSADGNKVFFSSARPVTDTGTRAKDYDIWYVERKGASWSTPHHLSTVVNTVKDEFYPSLSRKGNLYFTRDNGKTKEDILAAEWKNDQYAEPIPLPAEINSEGFDFNAFIDPDEEFIIFSSYKRPDDNGGGDLYISAKKEGQWQPAKNLGGVINSGSLDYCPFVSFDKKYFFFTTKKMTIKPTAVKLNGETVKKILSSPGNGTDDIYVMSFETIRQFLTQ
jgi:hypothetical protein